MVRDPTSTIDQSSDPLRGVSSIGMSNSRRTVRCLIIAGALLVSAPSALAQDIKVQESAGVTQGGGQATLSLRTTNDQAVSVRQIHQQMNLQVTSNFGYNAAGFGDVSSQLCVTPCKLSLPTGFYKLRFGDTNPMNANSPIDFNLGPGDHVYRVTPFNGGKLIGGFLMAVFGGSAAIVGTTLALVLKDGKVPFAVMAGAGVGVTVGGIVLINGASASAERM